MRRYCCVLAILRLTSTPGQDAHGAVCDILRRAWTQVPLCSRTVSSHLAVFVIARKALLRLKDNDAKVLNDEDRNQLYHAIGLKNM